jgi:membrane-bound lytic murein transglycosylase B
VRSDILAAINFIESNFGRLRNNSNAGAVGPMQFIPATWAAYGLGGDIRDPHDAIIGAANYLHANGAPHDYARAIYHYNPSPLYVNAVLRYARAMRRDPRTFAVYWSWQSFQRTPSGEVQLTGPGSRAAARAP